MAAFCCAIKYHLFRIFPDFLRSIARMFIRQTRTNNKATGEAYFTFRLVRGQRVGQKVRQVTLLNLGRHFPIAQDLWPMLCIRIEQLLGTQSSLCALECPEHVEQAAQRCVAQLITRTPSTPAHGDVHAAHAGERADEAAPSGGLSTLEPSSQAQSTPPAPAALAGPSVVTAAPNWQTVDIDSIQDSQPRSVGVEHVALHAIAQLGLVDKLSELGINGVMRTLHFGQHHRAHGPARL